MGLAARRRWRRSPARSSSACVVGGTMALGYFLALGVPAALAAYLAYLSRPSSRRTPTLREWYPAGRLMAGDGDLRRRLAGAAAALIGGSYESLRPLMVEVLQQFSRRWMQPGGAARRSRRWPSRPNGRSFCCPPALPSSGCAFARSTSIWPAASCWPRDVWGATGPTLPPSPIRRGFRLLLVLALLATNAGGHAWRHRHQLRRGISGRVPARRPRADALRGQTARALARLARLPRTCFSFGPSSCPWSRSPACSNSTFGLKQRLGSSPPST